MLPVEMVEERLRARGTAIEPTVQGALLGAEVIFWAEGWGGPDCFTALALASPDGRLLWVTVGPGRSWYLRWMRRDALLAATLEESEEETKLTLHADQPVGVMTLRLTDPHERLRARKAWRRLQGI